MIAATVNRAAHLWLSGHKVLIFGHYRKTIDDLVSALDDSYALRSIPEISGGFVAEEVRTGRVLAIAALDNLVKGAAGQMIQCANLMLGIEETAGLARVGVWP